jgi:hypothetical protein
MMLFMMRGGHGHGVGHQGHAGGRSGHDAQNDQPTLGELRRQRDQLARQIEEREAEEQTATPARGGWR